MKATTLFTIATATIVASGFSSCKSREEQAREERLEIKADNIEKTADQLRKDGEHAADAKEAQADAIRKNSENAADATEDAADATRKAVEKRADALEDEADKVREAK